MIAIVFGAASEFLQFLAPQRDVAVLDLVANEAGIVAGFLIGFLRRRRALQTG